MKKLSFGKTTQTNTSSSDSIIGSSFILSDVSLFSATDGRLHAVYGGRSRRRYLVKSDVVEHPVFRQLAEKSTGAGENTVGCEVVMFDHLLWMLENAEPQPESSCLDELVGYYAY